MIELCKNNLKKTFPFGCLNLISTKRRTLFWILNTAQSDRNGKISFDSYISMESALSQKWTSNQDISFFVSRTNIYPHLANIGNCPTLLKFNGIKNWIKNKFWQIQWKVNIHYHNHSKIRDVLYTMTWVRWSWVNLLEFNFFGTMFHFMSLMLMCVKEKAHQKFEKHLKKHASYKFAILCLCCLCSRLACKFVIRKI